MTYPKLHTRPHTKPHLAPLAKQQGIGFIGLICIFAIAGILVLGGLKVVPAYIEYNGVKGVISNMATSEEVKSGTVAQIRASFDRRASIAYVTVVKGEDLDITKDGNETVVTAAWSQRIPLFKNHTLLIDFSTSTADK